MDNVTGIRKSVLFIILFNLVLFSYSVAVRQHWFGIPSASNNQFVTGHSLLIAKNWYRDGIFNLGFKSIWYPDDITFKSLSDREMYVSFPCGAQLPVYVLSLLLSHEPDFPIIMAYNLLNHFLVSLSLSFLVFILLRGFGFNIRARTMFSMAPAVLTLLLPGPMYFFQNTYFAQEAVILPFVLVLIIDALRDQKIVKLLGVSLNWFEAIILFYGCFTDWLFFFLVACLFLKRLLNRQIQLTLLGFLKGTATLLALPLAAVTVHILIYVDYMDFFYSKLRNRFFLRTGLKASGSGGYWSQWVGGKAFSDLYPRFIKIYFVESMGHLSLLIFCFCSIALILCLLLMLYRFYKGKKQDTCIRNSLNVSFLSLVPCVLQVYFFTDHSVDHRFSTLKFIVPFSIIPFVIVPALFYRTMNQKTIKWLGGNLLPFTIAFLSLFAATSYALWYHPGYVSFFPEPMNSLASYASFIDENTGYWDVAYIGYGYDAVKNPIFRANSMKRVIMFDDMENMPSRVARLDDGAVINFINYHAIGFEISNPDSLVSNGNFSIVKIKKSRLQKGFRKKYTKRYALSLADMSGHRYDRGISTKSNELVLSKGAENPLGVISAGDKIIFADGTQRKVLNCLVASGNIFVQYEGPRMNPANNGYPHKIEVKHVVYILKG